MLDFIHALLSAVPVILTLLSNKCRRATTNHSFLALQNSFFLSPIFLLSISCAPAQWEALTFGLIQNILSKSFVFLLLFLFCVSLSLSLSPRFLPSHLTTPLVALSNCPTSKPGHVLLPLHPLLQLFFPPSIPSRCPSRHSIVILISPAVINLRGRA